MGELWAEKWKASPGGSEPCRGGRLIRSRGSRRSSAALASQDKLSVPPGDLSALLRGAAGALHLQTSRITVQGGAQLPRGTHQAVTPSHRDLRGPTSLPCSHHPLWKGSHDPDSHQHHLTAPAPQTVKWNNSEKTLLISVFSHPRVCGILPGHRGCRWRLTQDSVTWMDHHAPVPCLVTGPWAAPGLSSWGRWCCEYLVSEFGWT